IAATRAWIERLRVKPRYSEQWLERTIALADPNSQEFTAAWHTRLLIALFEEKNPRKARAILEALPESAANHALVEWIRELLDSEDAKMTERWRKVVDGLRQRKWTSCADALSAAIAADPRSEINRRGAALLLRGGLQPIVSSTMEEPITYPELMNEQAFQQAMLLLCGGDLSADMGKDDLRGYLLLQWARAQQTDAARSLVLMDLSDPSGSSLDYMDILNRYLNAEEQDQWVDKAVGEILLWPRNAYLLNRHLSDAKGHLVLMLARAKHALIRGEIRGGREKAENLESILGQIDDDLNLISPDFWNPETGRLLFLIRLYQAKLYERDGKWDFALAAYSQALDVLNRFPGDWEITAFDITAFKSLIEAGRADGDLLRLYLQTVAGMGDPLVNPPYAPDMAGTAAANIKTLEKHGVTDPARDRWLLPFLLYSAAGCQSLAGRPYEAIARLEAARRADPPEALLARILVEEAAVRATLRQHRMAARLLADLSALPLDPPRLAVAIKTRAQAESDAGMTASQSDRMRELAAELKLPAVWRRTILGEEDSRKPPEEKVMPR
ncbi:hypothetical protein HY256_06055, partial [Candidatus Sumerlaeota bacterium]|nr:hypothetical protein [Candidatus Sumerlaeota bacterium]